MYPNGYSNRLLIKTDQTKVSGSSDLSNFRMIFTHTDARLKHVSNGGKVQNANGWDIRFETLAGVKIDHEIVAYDGVNGKVEIWMKLPILYKAVPTYINFYYGKSGLIATEENLSGVWDSTYKAAIHGGISGDVFKNSADNTRNPARSGRLDSTFKIEQASSGKVGSSISFPGFTTFLDQLNGASDLPFGQPNNIWIAQSFQTDANGTISQYMIRRTANVGTPTNTGNFIAEIQADVGGNPSGTFLYQRMRASQDFHSNMPTGQDKWWDLAGHPNLQPNTTYWLVLKIAGTNASNYCNIVYNPSGVYGTLKTWNGTSWTTVPGTLRFRAAVSDYMLVPNGGFSFPYNSFSWEFWMKKTSTLYETIFADGIGNSEGRLDTGKTPARPFEWESNINNISQGDFAVSPVVPTDGAWHYYALVSDSSGMYMYADGNLTQTRSANADTTNQLIGAIGSTGMLTPFTYGYALNGELDEIILTANAPGADRIKTQYNNQNSPSTFSTVLDVTTSVLETIDAYVLASSIKTTSLSGYLLATQILNTNIAGYVLKTSQSSATISALMLKTQQITAAIDSYVLAPQSNDINIRGYILAEDMEHVEFDGWVKAIWSMNIDIAGYIIAKQDKNLSVNAYVDAPQKVMVVS